jgi:hypothetical protein
MSLPDIKARYTAKAIQCWFIDVESSGNVQIAVQCEVTDGEHAGERISWTGTFAPGKATEIAMKALKESFGWPGDDLAELDKADEAACATLLPNQVELSCDMDEYNHEYKLKVKWVNPVGGGRFGTPLAGDKLKAFAAKMRGTVRSYGGCQRTSTSRQTSAPAQPTQPKHPNAPGADDDIPF